ELQLQQKSEQLLKTTEALQNKDQTIEALRQSAKASEAHPSSDAELARLVKETDQIRSERDSLMEDNEKLQTELNQRINEIQDQTNVIEVLREEVDKTMTNHRMEQRNRLFQICKRLFATPATLSGRRKSKFRCWNPILTIVVRR